MSGPRWPELWFEDCQDVVPVDMVLLEARAQEAVGVLQQRSGNVDAGFSPETEALEISLVSDAEIARVHGEFLGDPTPTDVITFDHGELLIGAETAAREAETLGWPVERELLLYVVHGILHLQGLEDESLAGAAEMARVQEGILGQVWPLEASRKD